MALFIVAYLDPGTGSVILQGLIGGLLGAALIIKMFWRKIVTLFNKKQGDESQDKNNQAPN